MGDFFAKLFSGDGFMPRWFCGQWTDSLGWMHIVSDVAIFGAYAAIPAVLTFFVLRRRDVPFPPIFWLFAAFIMSCGAGHLVEAAIFWHPWYRLSGLVKLFTALVSWVTVVGLAMILPKALTLPGLARINAGLEHEIRERRQAEDSLHKLTRNLEQQVAQRTREVTLLHDIAAICNQAESIEQGLRNAITRICVHMRWPLGHALLKDKSSGAFESSRIWVHLGDLPEGFKQFPLMTRDVRMTPTDSQVCRALVEGKPQWIADVDQSAGLLRIEAFRACGVRAHFSFPVVVGDETKGIIEFFAPDKAPPDAELMTLTHEMGRLLGLVVERFELQRAIAESIESEQRRISEDLHDGLGQELTAMSLMAKSLHLALENQHSAQADRARELAEAIPRLVKQTRAIVRGMMPVEVDSMGLNSALQQLADTTEQRYGISCQFENSAPVWIDDAAVAHNLFRIAQEAIVNAVKHAKATELTLRLGQNGKGIELSVCDNGQGIPDVPAPSAESGYRGMGLRIMRHRANLIGATLTIARGNPGGTVVTCHTDPEE